MENNKIQVMLELGTKLKTFNRYSLKDKHINKEYAESVRSYINPILKSELEALGLPVQLDESTGFYDQKSIKSIDLLKHLKSSPLQTLYLFKFTKENDELIFRAALLYLKELVKSVVDSKGLSRADILAKKVVNPVNELVDSYIAGSLDVRSPDFLKKVSDLNSFFDSSSRLDKKVKGLLSEPSLILEAFDWNSDKKQSVEYLSSALSPDLLLECFVRSANSLAAKS